MEARSYMISNSIAYLTISDKSYPRKLAFSYLDELSKEFERSFGGRLAFRSRAVGDV
jgi:vesicle transport protein SEC22